jgi:molybdate transport system substrate-binding protein
MNGWRSFLTWIVACTVVSPAGCGGSTEKSPGGPADGGRVLALVAASTRDAVREAAAGFAREGNGEVRISADDSSKLAQQIAEGAPADLYLSANEKWADFVTEKGFAEERTLLLGGSLVIVVPKGNPAGAGKPQDLTRRGVKHLAVAGPTVPAGIYARQALGKLGLWGDLEGKVVSGESVRVTLAFVERGEAEAGIVYATDAKISDRVERVYEFDPATHEPIRYPLVLLKGARDHPAARRFYDYLQTPRAADIFRKYGFQVPGAK